MKMIKFNEIGRSMVEMLGVLAIIGVLSVGAIAGYSKAMMKYKLNKHAESFNQLLNNVIHLKPQLEQSFRDYSKFDFETFSKLNLIPDGMTADVKNKVILDNFGTRIYYYVGYHNEGRTFENYFNIVLSQDGAKVTKEKTEVCHNIVNIAKENAANIHNLQTRNHLEVSYSTFIRYGDLSTNTDPEKLLRNMTLEDVEQFCYACTSEKQCAFMLYVDVQNGLPTKEE